MDGAFLNILIVNVLVNIGVYSAGFRDKIYRKDGKLYKYRGDNGFGPICEPYVGTDFRASMNGYGRLIYFNYVSIELIHINTCITINEKYNIPFLLDFTITHNADGTWSYPDAKEFKNNISLIAQHKGVSCPYVALWHDPIRTNYYEMGIDYGDIYDKIKEVEDFTVAKDYTGVIGIYGIKPGEYEAQVYPDTTTLKGRYTVLSGCLGGDDKFYYLFKNVNDRSGATAVVATTEATDAYSIQNDIYLYKNLLQVAIEQKKITVKIRLQRMLDNKKVHEIIVKHIFNDMLERATATRIAIRKASMAVMFMYNETLIQHYKIRTHNVEVEEKLNQKNKEDLARTEFVFLRNLCLIEYRRVHVVLDEFQFIYLTLMSKEILKLRYSAEVVHKNFDEIRFKERRKIDDSYTNVLTTMEMYIVIIAALYVFFFFCLSLYPSVKMVIKAIREKLKERGESKEKKVDF